MATSADAGLYIPAVDPDADCITAALAYADAGWYVLPIKLGKHPGSVVGEGWPAKSSRDHELIVAWFAGTDYGIALHVGRSGAVVIDEDHPDQAPPELAALLDDLAVPFQSTRAGDPRRGHYLFAMPHGRRLGNSTGQLGNGFGDIRGANGVVVVAPSRHVKASEGGRYQWERIGVLPPLPGWIADRLRDTRDTATVATDPEIGVWIAAHTAETSPGRLTPILDKYDRDARSGSRHAALVACLTWGAKEANAGYFKAADLVMELMKRHQVALNDPRHPNGADPNRKDFLGAVAWAVAQAAVDPAVDGMARPSPHTGPQRPAADNTSVPAPAPAPEGRLTSFADATEGTPQPVSPHRKHWRLAQIFASEQMGRLLYVVGLGWHYYDGQRWARDDGDVRTTRAAGETFRAAWRTAAMMPEGEERRTFRADIAGCETASGTRGMLELARVLSTLSATVDQIDADPFMVNTSTGTVDLRTRELLPHNPAHRITKVTSGGYSPVAAAPIFDRFLTTVLPDQEVRLFLQRLAGLAMLGIVREHVLPIFLGPGQNGKSTFVRAIGHAIGDYYGTAARDLLINDRGHSPHGTELLELRGRRLVTFAETERGATMSEALMKELTGGDLIHGRAHYQAPVAFRPSHTAVMVTNHLPQVSGDDEAIWRRLMVVPFDTVISDSARDPQLVERLQLEVDGIVSWTVDGYASYVDRGLDPPDAVKERTAQYRADSDLIGRFLEDRCNVVPGAGAYSAMQKDLWAAWQDWARNNRRAVGTQKDFATRLGGQPGFDRRKTEKGIRWLGLALNP